MTGAGVAIGARRFCHSYSDDSGLRMVDVACQGKPLSQELSRRVPGAMEAYWRTEAARSSRLHASADDWVAAAEACKLHLWSRRRKGLAGIHVVHIESAGRSHLYDIRLAKDVRFSPGATGLRPVLPSLQT